MTLPDETAAADELVTGVEAALLGCQRRSAVDAWLDRVLKRTVGAGLRAVLFRAGRIDAVYAVATTDGRRLLVKVHRPPVDLESRRLTVVAQTALAATGFPCAVPVAGPLAVGGRVVSVETLLETGQPGNGHDARVRETIASTLAEQLAVLRGVPELSGAPLGTPAWCRYADGPWPTPHDPFFDFRHTPEGWHWLDAIAQQASTAILDARGDEHVAVAHADWYCGNLRFDDAELSACFDWDLVSDSTAVVAGLTAGFFTNSSTSGPEQPEPDEVVAFLTDFERAAGRHFDSDEQRAAAAAATWSMAYTARCQLQMVEGDPAPGSALDVLARQGSVYLGLRW